MEKFDSIKCKIQKLQAMIERGEVNEAANAQKLLTDLFEKYQIDISSITEEKVEWRHFRCKNSEEASILFHCYYKVMNVTKLTYQHYRHEYDLELNAYQYAEIKHMYEWHVARYRKDLDKMKNDLIYAFLLKHDLFSNVKSDIQNEDLTFSQEDFERYERLLTMTQILGNEQYYKMIGE